LVEVEISDGRATVGNLLPRGYTDARIGTSVGVSCDAEQNLVCWSDIDKKNIRCAQLDTTVSDGSKGRDIYTLLTNLNQPEGIALDPCSEALYWTDPGDGMLWMARVKRNDYGHLEALYQTPIITGLEKPRGIAVDSCAEYVFFTDWGNINPRIGRSALDGSNVVSIVSSPNAVRPNAVTLDRQSQILYYCDVGHQKIYSVSYHGSGLTVVANVRSVFDMALSCSREILYFTDWTVPFPRMLNLSSGQIVNIQITSVPQLLYGLCSFCDRCFCELSCWFVAS
jgi:hypothetical protein